MDDMNDDANWIKQAAPTLTATLSVDNNDYLKITATAGSGSVYWEKDIPNFLSDVYPKFRLRYETSSASIKAKVELIFTDGTQEILPASSSLTMTVVEGAVTAGKTIDKVRIYATSATGWVSYCFILIYQGDFQLPSALEVRLNLPQPRHPYISIPGKDGGIPQYLGQDLASVHIRGEMDLGEWGTPTGQFFYQVWHSSNELWQWFESADHGVKFKVKPSSPSFITARDGKLVFDLVLEEYRLGDVSKESTSERFGW